MNIEAILWKIKSHTNKINIIENYFSAKPRNQPYNNEADKLADLGKLNPENKEGIKLHINNYGLNHYYNKTRCLNGTNNFNIVRQFWLRMILESPNPD